VKCWAKAHDLNDPGGGTLNSFALSLLVLFHLQTGCSPPLLPPLAALLSDRPAAVLQEEAARETGGRVPPWGGPLHRPGPLRRALDGQHDLAAAQSRCEALSAAGFGAGNTASLPALLSSFFAHLAAILPALKAGAAPRPFAAAWGSASSHGWSKRYTIAIEDPFDATENPARSLFAGPQYERLVAATRRAAAALGSAAGADAASLRLIAKDVFYDAGAFDKGATGPLSAPAGRPADAPPVFLSPGRGKGRRGQAAKGKGAGREGPPSQAPNAVPAPLLPSQLPRTPPPPRQPPVLAASPLQRYNAAPPPPPSAPITPTPPQRYNAVPPPPNINARTPAARRPPLPSADGSPAPRTLTRIPLPRSLVERPPAQ
jgi:hypothetical protein